MVYRFQSTEQKQSHLSLSSDWYFCTHTSEKKQWIDLCSFCHLMVYDWPAATHLSLPHLVAIHNRLDLYIVNELISLSLVMVSSKLMWSIPWYVRVRTCAPSKWFVWLSTNCVKSRTIENHIRKSIDFSCTAQYCLFHYCVVCRTKSHADWFNNKIDK